MGDAPVVLLPGMLCTPSLWDPVRRRLGMPATAVHLQGSSVDHAARAVLRNVEHGEFHLVGCSLGGIVALAIARLEPQRLRTLCLVGTNPNAPRPDQLVGWDTLEDIATRRGCRAGAASLMPSLLGDRPRQRHVAQVLAMADEVGLTGLATHLSIQRSRVDQWDSLRKFSQPVLCIAAELDQLCPVELHEQMAAAAPDAQLAVIPRSSHLSPIQAPSVLARSIAAWVTASQSTHERLPSA